MSGNRIGGQKAAKTNREKHGDDFYANIGKKGGSVSHPDTRWFSRHPELARKYGAKGGRISRRGPSKKNKGEEYGERGE